MNAAFGSGGISTQAFLGVGTFLVVLAGLCVAARFVVNSRSHRFSIADWVSAAAVVILAGTFANFYLITQAMVDPNSTLFYLAQLVAASNPIAASATWFAKAPIFLLFIHLFGVKLWLRWTSYAALLVTLLYLLGWNIWVGINCVPYSPDDVPALLVSCAYAGSVAGVACGAFNVVVGLLIFLLPLPVITKLQLPIGKKVGVAVVFLIGILAVVASSIALYYKRLSLSGVSTDLKAAMILTIVELSIAIVVSCAPVIHSFWSSVVVNLAFYSRIQIAVSSISILRPSQSTRTKNSQQSRQPLNGSSE
ncbi:hypothetical protein GGS23DRAFT_558809 [Durotheca rogersii]|uniref:uncharacterized protein n=1 Tax=Durotheca rogersii TaxID=419775 RepID=UPI00221EF87A|nr:uncharacterized protein GGS23DRAFT_558809 [Durotheca rogersii]KAI5865351.1 hypothetical protein GGS23DRAFT_558809 [Durotheca rogersii]